MLGRVTVAILFLVLVWGNMVAGLKAGLACPDWPLCHGRVLPPLRWDIYMEFLPPGDRRDRRAVPRRPVGPEATRATAARRGPCRSSRCSC